MGKVAGPRPASNGMNPLEVVENQTHQILDAMGYRRLSVTEVKEREGRVFVSVFINNPRDLIGERGTVLRSFQHLVRLTVANKLAFSPRIDIDVNNYKKKRAEFLADFARHIGERVRAEKKKVELEPMSAFDRRVVHSTLAEYTDIMTTSRGEEPRRYIIVGPYSPEG